MNIAIIGGGPAGLRAAEVAAAGGANVTLFDAKPSVGRKFLVAGRGGLNLTREEPSEQFVTRYSGEEVPDGLWASLLDDFDADALRAWAAGLGVETFAASTGRVYPRELKAANLLRRWVERLRELGVRFAMNHRWKGLSSMNPLTLEFQVEEKPMSVAVDAVVLAMGGGSWPETGSDGQWVPAVEQLGVGVTPLQPANSGWEIAWPMGVLERAEGEPLKNIVVSAGEVTVAGELLITAYGVEGGALYQLTPKLRSMASPEICIDFKPTFSEERLLEKMGPSGKRSRDFLQESRQRWRLGEAACAILEMLGPFPTAESLARAVKECRLKLQGPRPLAEAISSAGGVRWRELDSQLMVRRIPGVFVAGEMIDWEAPTGGYLIQGCFATGTRAGRSALAFGGQIRAAEIVSPSGA